MAVVSETAPGLRGRARGHLQRDLAPVVVVLAATVALWGLFGVGATATLRYLGYEAAFDVVPGVLALWVLTGRRSLDLRTLAVGWPLGYALELGFFGLTASTGERSLFAFYPLLCLPALAAWWGLSRRARMRSGWRAGAPPELRVPAGDHAPAQAVAGTGSGSGWRWGVAVVLLMLLGYVAADYFVFTPLPGRLTGPVSYYQDYVWQVSVAAEALHVWPVQIPNVAGLTLHYHLFAFLHMAAISQVTGLDPALVNFRLYIVPLLGLAVAQLVVLGRLLSGGRSWPGIVGAVLVFLLGPWDPLPTPPSEFLTHIWQSASFGFGLPLFLAATIEITAVLRSRARTGRREAAGGWCVVLVLLFACGGAKSSILPDVIGALGLLAVYCRRYARASLTPVLTALGLAVACFLLFRYSLYRGTNGLLGVHPLAEVKVLQPLAYVLTQVHWGPLRVAFEIVSAAIEVVKLLLPLLFGLWAYVLIRRDPRDTPAVWLLALLVVSVLVFLAVTTPGGSEVYFLYYGFVAAAPLAGAGLYHLWTRLVPPLTLRAVPFALIVIIGLLAWIHEGPLGARNGQPVASPFWYRATGPQAPPGIEDANIVANADLTPSLYAGLLWTRTHTPPTAILAVNNRWQDIGEADARYYYYSAFSQRRVLLEGDQGTNELGQGRFLPYSVAIAAPFAGPFGERVALVDAMIHGSRDAMVQAVRRYHVDYLLIDLYHLTGADRRAIERVVQPVFANAAMALYPLRGLAA